MRGLAAAALSLLVALGAATPALAQPEAPRNLEVAGHGEWQASPDFRVFWGNPGGSGGLAAVHYLLRDSEGRAVEGPSRTSHPVESLWIEVPRSPGEYRFEAWLESGDGSQGPAAATLLRFDDRPPGRADPSPHRSWIGRPELPLTARIAAPSGALPPSGIRGYAVSVDRDATGEPCADSLLCAEDEVDLRGGAGDDALEVGELPEGLSYLHAVAVSGAGVHSASVGTTPLWVDRTYPATRLSGVADGWVNRPVTLRASATDSGSGMGDERPGGSLTAIAVDGAPPSASPGPATSVTLIGSGVHRIVFYARDAAGNADDGAVVNGRPDPPPETAVLRIDRDPPQVAFVPSTHPDQPELLEARVTDQLSGPDASRGWIGVRSAGSGLEFEPLPTRAEDDRLRARWNSDDYPPGEYEFAALGRDRAGNLAVGTRRASGAPMTLPSPLKSSTLLAARLVGVPGGDSGSVAHGRGVLYGGRLTLASGTAIGGAPVRVVERFASGAPLPSRATTVETGADGGFALRLAPGPSRTVEAVFAGNASKARATSSAATLRVRAGVRLRASARVATIGGRPVVFSGRIAGEVPIGGLPVELQFHLPGVPWTEFRTVQSDDRGRFHYAYRFADDDSRGVRFLFRAAVEAAAGWPYETGASLPVPVRGR